MNQMLIYQIAIPLFIILILLWLWNEIRKRGDKFKVEMAPEYTWNRCFFDGVQGIIILKVNFTSKKKRQIILKDSSLEIVRDFKLPIPADHVPTIMRVGDTELEPNDFIFSRKEIVFDDKGEVRSGLDVFLTDAIPKKGKKMVVEYSWFDERWRKNSRQFTIYIDRGEKQIVL